jgi:hypothetical protein
MGCNGSAKERQNNIGTQTRHVDLTPRNKPIDYTPAPPFKPLPPPPKTLFYVDQSASAGQSTGQGQYPIEYKEQEQSGEYYVPPFIKPILKNLKDHHHHPLNPTSLRTHTHTLLTKPKPLLNPKPKPKSHPNPNPKSHPKSHPNPKSIHSLNSYNSYNSYKYSHSSSSYESSYDYESPYESSYYYSSSPKNTYTYTFE